MTAGRCRTTARRSAKVRFILQPARWSVLGLPSLRYAGQPHGKLPSLAAAGFAGIAVVSCFDAVVTLSLPLFGLRMAAAAIPVKGEIGAVAAVAAASENAAAIPRPALDELRSGFFIGRITIIIA